MRSLWIRYTLNPNIGALVIRVGFGGPLYYNHNKEPPNIVLVIFGGRGIQDAPCFPVRVYKVQISLQFPPYSGSLQTPHKFCSDKAFILLLYYNPTELPIIKYGRIFKMPLVAGHISQTLTPWNPNNWPMTRHLRLTKHTYAGRGAYIFQLDHRILW